MNHSMIAWLRTSRGVRALVMLALVAITASSITPASAATPASSSAAPGYPAYIRVGRTFSTRCVARPVIRRVDVVPFKEYVKSVLPHEWYATWHDESLNAGAVAVAQFAYRTGFVEKKWSRRGYNFDVVDSTCDQVYIPGRTHPRTNAAVDRMWGTKLLRNGQTITPFYRADWTMCGRIADCMGQRGSQKLALQGWNATQILKHYYGPVDVVR